MNIEQTKQQQATDFFNSLKHYHRIFPGTGVPIFMYSTEWYNSLTCVVVINCLCAALMLKLCFTEWKDSRFYINSTLICLCLFNLFYLLTQFINPGIVYNRLLSADPSGSMKMCDKCFTIRDSTAFHCDECEVCVQDLDHHCGWFGRCIAGGNKWWFYLFLLATFVLFVNVIVTGTELIAG